MANVSRNEFGTPLLNDLFEKGQMLAQYELISYVNADIILMGDFTKAIQRVKDWRKQFLLTGIRRNVDISGLLDFSQPEWEKSFRRIVHKKGKLLTKEKFIGFDYFVFTRNFFRDIPPFAVGRGLFDVWLLWRAKTQRVPIVDATAVVMAVHQNHDYSHIKGMKEGAGLWEALEGKEAQKNVELAGPTAKLLDTNYRLTNRGVRFDLGGHFRFRERSISIWFFLLWLSGPFRRVFGLRTANLQKLKILFAPRRSGELL